MRTYRAPHPDPGFAQLGTWGRLAAEPERIVDDASSDAVTIERALNAVDGLLARHPDALHLLELRARALVLLGRNGEALPALERSWNAAASALRERRVPEDEIEFVPRILAAQVHVLRALGRRDDAEGRIDRLLEELFGDTTAVWARRLSDSAKSLLQADVFVRTR